RPPRRWRRSPRRRIEANDGSWMFLSGRAGLRHGAMHLPNADERSASTQPYPDLTWPRPWAPSDNGEPRGPISSMSLALSTLLYEWRRYMAAVMALALSGLLVLAMTGVFIGIGKGFTATIERSRADIIVMQPGAKNLMSGPSGVPRRFIPL